MPRAFRPDSTRNVGADSPPRKPAARQAPAHRPRPAASCRPPLDIELGCADALFLFEPPAAIPAQTISALRSARRWSPTSMSAPPPPAFPTCAPCSPTSTSIWWRCSPDTRCGGFYQLPHPWFQAGAEARRLVTPGLAAQLAGLACTRRGAVFRAMWGLSLDAMAVLETTPGLRNVAGSGRSCAKNPYPARSLREVRCWSAGCRCGGCSKTDPRTPAATAAGSPEPAGPIAAAGAGVTFLSAPGRVAPESGLPSGRIFMAEITPFRGILAPARSGRRGGRRLLPDRPALRRNKRTQAGRAGCPQRSQQRAAHPAQDRRRHHG